jgi:hypothetical protein
MPLDKMNKFEFLLGDWDLEYRILKSIFGDAGTDFGTGSFKRALKDKYVFFDYSTISGSEAHGIFAWEDKTNLYKYWWFENSGNYLTASCNFIDDKTLSMNWHDTLLIQTFVKDGPDRVVLKMLYPIADGKYELVLEVIFTKKQSG